MSFLGISLAKEEAEVLSEMVENYNITIKPHYNVSVVDSHVNALNLSKNYLKYLPDCIARLEQLESIILDLNEFKNFPEPLKGLKKLTQISLRENKIATLPDWIGNFKNLKWLTLNSNQLTSLPDSFTNLLALEELDLSNNHLTTLPDSIELLKNLRKIDLRNNRLTSIPYKICLLKNLKEFSIEENWLIGKEDHQYIDRDLKSILRYCRKKLGIQIFISHAVADFYKYRIEDIASFLVAKPGIFQVIFCEQNLTGNIDEFMNENVPKSDLVLFMATKYSLLNSKDCKHELELAAENMIDIISIKASDIVEGDLKGAIFSHEYLNNLKIKEFNNFCNDLYEYIQQYIKKDVIAETWKGTSSEETDRKIFWLKNLTLDFMDSSDFYDYITENYDNLSIKLEKLKEQKTQWERFRTLKEIFLLSDSFIRRKTLSEDEMEKMEKKDIEWKRIQKNFKNKNKNK